MVKNDMRKVLNEINISEEKFIKAWRDIWLKVDVTPYKFAEYLCRINNRDDPNCYRELSKIISLPLEKIKVFSDVIPCLERIKSKGIYTITISDCGPDVVRYIHHLNLDLYFEKCFFSFEEGKTKETGLYNRALQVLCVEPSTITMIGNDYKRDYLIPKRLGINPILINRESKRGDSNTLTKVLESLGI